MWDNLVVIQAVIRFKDIDWNWLIVFFKSVYVPIASRKIDTIPLQNVIFQFILVEHFLWVMFAYFVIDYGLNTIFEAFLVFVLYVDTRLFYSNPFW